MSSKREGEAANDETTSDVKRPRTSAFGRSVLDYVTTSELDEALLSSAKNNSNGNNNNDINSEDWKLPIPDPENSTSQEDEQMELQRLLTLKSYMLLDAEKEDAFDQLTMEAREIFGVPTSIISLIDLGRQFFFSNTGGGDVRETSRQVAFCNYTIASKHDVTIVPDASNDFRFQNGPLVKEGPKLRFYAAAPLISPEGYKLGAFCVEGPTPRPQGLNDDEKIKLKQYAAATMELMVERRKRLRDVLSNNTISMELRTHAAVATSLGDYMFENVGDLVTAMHLYQESIQTIMHAESHQSGVGTTTTEPATDKSDPEGAVAAATPPPPPPPPVERQKAMAQLLSLLSAAGGSSEESTKKELMAKVVALYEKEPTKQQQDGDDKTTSIITDHGIAGLFHVPPKLKGLVSDPQPLPALFFHEVFKIDMRGCLPPLEQELKAAASTSGGGGEEEGLPPPPTEVSIVVTPFTVPIEECSKATLFNMGQIHYHWNNPETAMQFFHLAASVSHKISPLQFDPIDISCINNMAQIHLQYGQSDDAMKMLTETLERGNRSLAAMYRQTETESELLAATKTPKTSTNATTATSTGYKATGINDDDSHTNKSEADDDDVYDYERMEEISAEMDYRDMFRTVRLRRKLARTLINIAHVHFFNCNYDASMASLKGAIPLLDAKVMTGRTLAAIWYNMSLVYYHQGGMLQEALEHLDKFLELAIKLNGPDHLQNANALYRKARILFEMGNADAAMEPIEQSLRIRKLKLGSDHHASIAEALCFKGKILLSRKECDAALEALNTCLEIQRKQQELNHSSDVGEGGGGGGDLTFEMAQTMLDIGQAYHILGQVDASLEQYLEVLEWTRKFFGPKHAFVARVDGIIGNIYVQVGKLEESKPYLDEAAAILQEQVQKTTETAATTTTS